MNQTPVSEEARSLLDDIAAQTASIREHQRLITSTSDQRRNKILRLRELRITYREIAAAMDVTEQSVYKVLRESIAQSKHVDAVQP